MDAAKIIDEIYEAAVAPERWTKVLDRVAAISDAEGTLLFTQSANNVRWLCSPAIHDVIVDWTNNWMERDDRGPRLIPIREPRFLTDYDGFTQDELDRSPFYNEFLRPRGLGWCVGTAIHSPADTLVFSVERRFDRGPVERPIVDALDTLRPHLARAALLSARIGLQRARATVDGLQAVGLPAAVLTDDGRALAANDDFGKCAPSIVTGARDQIVFADPAARAIFVEALADSQRVSSARTGRSIAMPGNGADVPLVAHILPLRGIGRDIFSGASSLLVVTPVARQKAPEVQLLEVLFDLTPSEARVASSLVEGKSVDTIAQLQGVAKNTVRMHLKSVFHKTGIRRQADLVSLLALPRYGQPE